MFASWSSRSMRPGLCTVVSSVQLSPPVTAAAAGAVISLIPSLPAAAAADGCGLPPSARYLALHLLQQQTLYCIVQVKTRVRDLYQQTCKHFAQQGMLDTDLFGLALICDGEYLFAEPDSKLSKYAPKSWRSSHSHGLDAAGRPALAFHFRVQFYVDSPLLLRDEITRHHYYLQLRLNTAAGAAAEHTTRLAGLALQADVGDYTHDTTPALHPLYRPEDYIPPTMRQPAALRALETAHRGLRTLARSDARARFIATACQLQEPINAHVFRLRASKTELAPGTLLLAVCPRGLRVCPENNPPSVFLWSSIGKLSFERKKFEIRTGHEKLTLYTSSDEKSRLLLSLCRAAHQFSMAVAPRLNEARRAEEEEEQRELRLRCWGDEEECREQRTSVISSASSTNTTTSGIVSDRPHSEDELEIMITSPPAPSTESLALAHLLDSTPASSRTSAASAAAAAAVLPSLVALELELDEVLVVDRQQQVHAASCCSDSSEARSVAAVTAAAGNKCAAAGSQCSSSCSTVVVTPAFTKPKGGAGAARRPSTSSSLELGYSHTAQNSALSDAATCIIELDTRSSCEPEYSTAAPAPSSHTSGVYTLTSSDQYTTLSEPEEEEEEDRVDGVDGSAFRERTDSSGANERTGDFRDRCRSTSTVSTPGQFRDRSNSNVSNSGSFRGDGSDPTDNQQTLLTADELSDLIVGRYPSCKSVSNTLDSDSDYVTFQGGGGYVPVPPVRVDSVRPPPPPYGAPYVMHHHLKEIPGGGVIPPPVYPSEEATARFITTRPASMLTAHSSHLGGVGLAPSYTVPPIPPKVPRGPASVVSAGAFSGSSLSIGSSSCKGGGGGVLVPCAAFLPPPPPPVPRQPPPPPPPPPQALATVYTSQLSRSQIEQYRQQMYSDVDFVVFPLKEPAISKQEYLEAKQGSLLAALAQTQPVFYRSTPYLGRYASSQNLSDTYVQLPVYAPASIASTTGSLEQPVPPPLPPNRPATSRFMRTQSDENILNSIVDGPVKPVQTQPPRFRRLPPPPPPPLNPNSIEKLDSDAAAKQNALDIRTLRETSKKMDLPLISALCNDRSLIKQTKAFVMPKHPNDVILQPRHVSSKVKYPVSGLHKVSSSSSSRKPLSISHRHPGDKLPDLPKDNLAGNKVVPTGVVTTRATPNNYVFTDPRVKHKSMQSSHS